MKFLKTHEHKEKHRSSISSNCELVQIHMGRSKLDQEGWIKREKSPPMEVLSIAKEFYRLSKNAPPEISQKQLDRLRTMAIYRETGEVKGGCQSQNGRKKTRTRDTRHGSSSDPYWPPEYRLARKPWVCLTYRCSSPIA